MFQDEGASMDVIGKGVCSRREMMAGKGARISPEKEKPVQLTSEMGWFGGEGKTEGASESMRKGFIPKMASTT